MTSPILVLCEACGSEGRIYHGGDFDPWAWSEECPYCEGTGAEFVEGEPVTEEEIMEPAIEHRARETEGTVAQPVSDPHTVPGSDQ